MIKNCGTYAVMLICLFVGFTSCQKNPLGEEVSQPILNSGFLLKHSCSTAAMQDAAYTCQPEVDVLVLDESLTNLLWTFEAGTTCDWVVMDTVTAAMAGTPNNRQVGTCDLVILAKNSTRRSLPLLIQIHVGNIAPTLTIANAASLLEDAAATVIHTDAAVQASEENLGGTYSLDNVAVTAPSCASQALSLTINSTTGEVTYRPSANSNGTCMVKVVFNDNTGSANAVVTDEFAVTVTPVNDAPNLAAIADQTTVEDTPRAVAFTMNDIDSVVACSAPTMTYSSSVTTLVNSSGISFSGTVPNCIATITPRPNQSGTTVITLNATDGALTTTVTFNFVVTAMNDTPVISAIGTHTTLEETPSSVNFTITDVDSTLSCTTSLSATSSNATLLPVGNISFSGTAPNCTASFTPLPDQNGSSNLSFRATDGVLTGIRNFTYTVTPVNDAPEMPVISDITLKTDATATVNFTFSDRDSFPNCTSSITVTSSDQAALPDANIISSGAAPNCTLTITPTENLAATSVITVNVSDGALSVSQTFNVNLVNVISLGLNRTTLSLGVSATSQLALTANYSDASSRIITTDPGTSWVSLNSGIAAVDDSGSKGLVTAVADGSTTVSATFKSLTTSAQVQVVAITSLAVSSGFASGGIGASASISAMAQSTTSTFNVTTSSVWITSDPAVATVSNGLITFAGAGSAVVTVSYGGLSSTVQISVLAKNLISIEINLPSGSTVQKNGTKNLTATATYSDSSTQDVTSAVTWVSGNTSVLTISNTLPNTGRVIGHSAGTSLITATLNSASANLLMTVTTPTLTSIEISPADQLVTSNGTYQLRALGTYNDATTADITSLVTWTSSSGTAATISNALGSEGLITTPSFTGYRSTTISATLSGITGTTPLGVNGSTVLSIVVTPMVTLLTAEDFQLKAYANLSDGGAIDVTESAVWTTSAADKVSVSNSLGSKGRVTGVDIGNATITAYYGGANGAQQVTVDIVNAVSEIGTGLNADYYTYTGGGAPASPFDPANKKGSRLDAAVHFSWGTGASPMGAGNSFAVRWTGFFKASSATHYFCTFSDDGVRVWVDGVQVINNWTPHSGTWDCSGAISMTPNEKYTVVVEYFEGSASAEAHLTQSTVSEVDAQDTATRFVPQSMLFPN